MSTHARGYYRIDKDLCTACCDCLKVCPEHAIRKATSDLCAKCAKYCTGFPGFQVKCSQNKMCIDQQLCTGCGKCVDVCTFDAIGTFPPSEPCAKCGSRTPDCCGPPAP